MNEPKWTEVDAERWRTHMGPLTVDIHRHPHVDNVWLLSTRPGLFENREIGGGSASKAKQSALMELRRWVERVVKHLPPEPPETP